MKKVEHQFNYLEYQKENDLPEEKLILVNRAEEISSQAYAPYSLFKVGAAIRFEDDSILTGNNQENVAYPSGLCAERVALFYAKSQFPELKIKEIAITASCDKFDVTEPVTPCGSCRQALLEYENNQGSPIEVILSGGQSSNVVVIESVKDLLPLSFKESKLRN